MSTLVVKWIYVLEQDYTWKSGRIFKEDLAFEDKSGVRRLELRKNGDVTVLKGYAWDGCTPKFCVIDLIFGIPDGAIHQHTKKPKAYFASMVHDAFYQFMDNGLPLNRKEADTCFLRLMKESNFALSGVYYAAVRVFGGIVRRIAKLIRKTKGKKVLLAPSGS